MDQYKSSPADRSLATLAAGDFGRPYVMPPNTPTEHVRTMREAFAKTLNDEAVKADAAKKKLELDPSSADELEKLAKEVTSQPPDIIAKMKTPLAK